MESIRSPLSGEDDIDMNKVVSSAHSNSHRRHRSAGSLDMTNQDVMQDIEKQSEQQVDMASNFDSHERTDSPRIIDGLYSRKYQPEKLDGDEKDKRILEIIEQQFNLEILLKHNQLAEIEEEIGKCEAQMIALRNQYKIDPSVKLPNEPLHFTEKYLQILQKADGLYSRHRSVTWRDNYMDNSSAFQQANGSLPQQGHHANSETLYSRTRSHTSSLRPISGRYSTSDCIYRRTDGVYVKLTCPTCGRCNFSSAQGFLNHCRLAHQKEFTSQDNAAITCGEILHEDDQDPEGLQVIANLKESGLDPNKNLAKPEVPFLNQMLQSEQTSASGLGSSNAAIPDAVDEEAKRKSKNLGSGLVKPSKAPRTTDQLKLRMKTLGKDSEFEDLVNEVTADVDNPHLFDDEEEGDVDDTVDTPASNGTRASFSDPRPSNSTSSRGRGRGRGRRKFRGGFSLLNENSSPEKLKTSEPDAE